MTSLLPIAHASSHSNEHRGDLTSTRFRETIHVRVLQNFVVPTNYCNVNEIRVSEA